MEVRKPVVAWARGESPETHSPWPVDLSCEGQRTIHCMPALVPLLALSPVYGTLHSGQWLLEVPHPEDM